MTNDYPYGQFPTKFTKMGQQKYFEQLNKEQNEPVSVMNTSEQPQQTEVQNNFDISKLLPLLKLMGDKKSMTTSDMLSMFLPMLGGNTSQLGDIMQLLNKDNQVKEVEEDILPPSPKISEYKRID